MTIQTKFNPGDRVHVVSQDYPRCECCNAAKTTKMNGRWVARESTITAVNVYARDLNRPEISYFSNREGFTDTHPEADTLDTADAAVAECTRRNTELAK
jgi:hypothetical protein